MALFQASNSEEQFTPELYKTARYNGTTTSGAIFQTINLPAGTYMVFPTGYSSGYGAYLYKDSTSLGSVYSVNNITLETIATIRVGSASSESTAYTNFCMVFIKVA